MPVDCLKIDRSVIAHAHKNERVAGMRRLQKVSKPNERPNSPELATWIHCKVSIFLAASLQINWWTGSTSKISNA